MVDSLYKVLYYSFPIHSAFKVDNCSENYNMQYIVANRPAFCRTVLLFCLKYPAVLQILLSVLQNLCLAFGYKMLEFRPHK